MSPPRGRMVKYGDGTFASPATRTTKPTRSAVDIHSRTLRLAVMPAQSPITRSPSRRTATPSVKNSCATHRRQENDGIQFLPLRHHPLNNRSLGEAEAQKFQR